MMVTDTPQYIYSRLADHPDLGDIVDLFVEEMPGRAELMLSHLRAKNWQALGHAAHQLKGAAGSHGFDAIAPCAGRVESAVRDGDPEDQIRQCLAELIDLCSRARGRSPQNSQLQVR